MEAENEDRLARLRLLAENARFAELEVAALEESLQEKKAFLRRLLETDMPDLMREARVDSIGLEANGNYPAIKAELKSFYRASIPASWDKEKIKEAINLVSAYGGEDIVQTFVEYRFGRGERQLALDLAKKTEHLSPLVNEKVHHSTLTSWLKDRLQNGLSTPDLESIGAQVGDVVKIKRVK